MKTKIAVLTVLFLAVTVWGQERAIRRSEVPKPVLDAFAKAYPHAKAKGYSTETENGKTMYEIESVEGKTLRDVSFTVDGALVVTEETVSMNALPEAVRAALAKDFTNVKITRCEKITEGNGTSYEVAMKSGKKRSEVVFNGDGTVAKKE